MKLTFVLPTTITHLYPNQVDNEQAVQSLLCLCVCCVDIFVCVLVCFDVYTLKPAIGNHMGVSILRN